MNRDTHRIDGCRVEEERGQTMAEYAMIISVITLAILLTIVLIGDSAGDLINEVEKYL